MKVVPFHPSHLRELTLQPSQIWLGGQISPSHAEALAHHPAFSGVVGNRVVGCAGVIKLWEGRYMAWALLAADAGRYMVAIHRAVKNFLDTFPARRIEATVDEHFTPGHRWIEKLGFQRETPSPMQGYRPDGGACHLYAMVR